MAWGYSLEMVPVWCKMTVEDHQDGIGGCWSISHGNVTEAECKTCEFYESPELAMWQDDGGEGGA